jgi:hypothetical protein
MRYPISRLFFKKPPHQWLCGQIAVLRGTHNLAVYPILSRFLRSVCLALYPARSQMRWFLGAFLLGMHLHVNAALSDVTRIFHQTPTLGQFEVCQGGGCLETNQLSVNDMEWRGVLRIFQSKATNAEAERAQIAQAIGEFERIVGAKNGTAADLAGTFFDGKLAGQLDCNDEAINTTTYMRLLKTNGLMQFHEVEDTRTRNFFFTGWPHSTAVIRDIETSERYAVDSWFYDNGKPATIVTFAKWKANYRPDDSPIGKAKTSQPASAQTAHSSGATQGGQ